MMTEILSRPCHHAAGWAGRTAFLVEVGVPSAGHALAGVVLALRALLLLTGIPVHACRCFPVSRSGQSPVPAEPRAGSGSLAARPSACLSGGSGVSARQQWSDGDPKKPGVQARPSCRGKASSRARRGSGPWHRSGRAPEKNPAAAAALGGTTVPSHDHAASQQLLVTSAAKPGQASAAGSSVGPAQYPMSSS
jgi:hypothetical protein